MTIDQAWPSMLRRAIKKGLIVIGPDGDCWEGDGETYHNLLTGEPMVIIKWRAA